MSQFAEAFFRNLANRQHGAMLLKKGQFHCLIAQATLSPAAEADVRQKLDLLEELFRRASGKAKR